MRAHRLCINLSSLYKYNSPMTRPESIFTNLVAALLLLSGLCHVFRQQQTKRIMSKPAVVRLVGACLLLLAMPCLLWRGWFFWTLFVLLAISGVWRLCFPHHSIRAQQSSYPRWVHGVLLLTGALAVWALGP
jgi:uncharacterized membrane protein